MKSIIGMIILKTKLKIRTNLFLIFLIILKMNFLDQFKHFIIMFIKVIFQALMMKCFLELIVINLGKEQMKNQLLDLIVLLDLVEH